MILLEVSLSSLYDGDNPDYEIACDECDCYLACFPDWREMIEGS